MKRSLSYLVVATPVGYGLGWVLARTLDLGDVAVWLTMGATQALAVVLVTARADESNDI